MNHIAVIGEAVADAFVSTVQGGTSGALDLRVLPGGGPANTAVALGRLGIPTRFVGRLPNGPFGDLLRDYLASSGVDLSLVVEAQEEPTLALATVDRQGRARYSFYAEGTADWQWTREELSAHSPSDEAACIHTGSLALALEPGGPLIEELLRARRGSTTISIDPNVRPGIVPLETYRRLLPGWTAIADVFRLSQDDLDHLRPGADLAEVCDEWHADGVRLVVITLGADGVIASLGGRRYAVPARPVEPVDTVGAGDAFTAGLLYRLHTGGALGGELDRLDPALLIRALTFASDVAAEACRHEGANPPWLADLQA
ncbi:carbohydrate kinase [Actinocorallia lasiicapitis]